MNHSIPESPCSCRLCSEKNKKGIKDEKSIREIVNVEKSGRISHEGSSRINQSRILIAYSILVQTNKDTRTM